MSILIISLENTFFLHNRLPGLQRIETIVQSVPISPISSFVCDSHLMRLGTSVAIKGPIERHHQVHGLFRFPELYLISLFAAPGPRAGHYIGSSHLLMHLLSVAVSPTVLVCDDLGSFEEHRSGPLYNASQLEFAWCFPLSHPGVMGFWKITQVKHHSYHILPHQHDISICVDLAHLAKVTFVCQISLLRGYSFLPISTRRALEGSPCV